LSFVILDKNIITEKIRDGKQERILPNGQAILRVTKNNEDFLNSFIKYTEDEIRSLDLKSTELFDSKINGSLEKVKISNTTKQYAISDNLTEDGKVLYTKIHGQKAIVQPGETHQFELINPYSEIYFQGAEIMQDIIGVSNFHIKHPTTNDSSEQYGYTVNMGTIKYIRESKYAARIPFGLKLTCEYINDTTETQEVGVNFLLHEIREA
jgi:hypothetical protein